MSNKTYTIFQRYHNTSVVWKILVCLFIACYASNISYGKIETSTNNIYTDNYVTVSINVQGIGAAEIPAIVKDDIAYLSVTDIFDLLKIKNEVSVNFDAITGFIVNEKATFVIDKLNNRITYQDKIVQLKPDDIITTESNMYLRSNYFGDIFGLECSFNFRNLSIDLTAKFELPAVREARIETLRHNMGQLSGTLKADTTIQRTNPLFHFGAVDWNVIATQQRVGLSDLRMNTRFGATLLGGEASALLYYSSTEKFKEKAQFYFWRYANNDNTVVKQVIVGKLGSVLSSTLYNPLVGVQVTNTPTSFRRSFGSYTLSNTTQPGWLVELYVNGVLVDYKKADASGFYTFQVPLVYGNSVVKLRFYGPYGEERSREENITIPFNFLPSHVLEYSAAAGFVEDDQHSRFSRAAVNYGLNRHITMSTGVEYLSSVTSGNTMPFINTSIMVTSRLLAAGEYIHGVRSKGLLTYRLPSNLQFDLNYTKYAPEQTAIKIQYTEERKASATIPIRGKHFAILSRLSYSSYTIPETKYSTAEWMLSGSLLGINTSLSTYASFYKGLDPYIFTTLAFAVNMPKKFVLTPMAQYSYQQHQLISLKGTIEKNVSTTAYINTYCEYSFLTKMPTIGVGLRYSFSQVQLSSTTIHNRINTTFTESARGSVICDSKTNYVKTNTYVNSGRGGISIIPYVDLNCNNHRDADEPMAYGLKFRINGGRIDKNNRDSIIHIQDLEPYTSYFLELDSNSFDNIAWKLQKKVIKVNIAPNQFTKVEVPIFVVGEASGSVYTKTGDQEKEQGRIKVMLINSNGAVIDRTVTDMGGFFSFENLTPGNYIVKVDSIQLKNLNLFAQPSAVNFTIFTNPDGDVVEKLRFTLMSASDTIAAIQQPTDTTVLSNVAIANQPSTHADTTTQISTPRLQLKSDKKEIPTPQQSPFMIHMKENKDTYIQVYNVIMPPPCVLGFYIFRKVITSIE